jgi:hypothetical protein
MFLQGFLEGRKVFCGFFEDLFETKDKPIGEQNKTKRI